MEIYDYKEKASDCAKPTELDDSNCYLGELTVLSIRTSIKEIKRIMK